MREPSFRKSGLGWRDYSVRSTSAGGTAAARRIGIKAARALVSAKPTSAAAYDDGEPAATARYLLRMAELATAPTNPGAHADDHPPEGRTDH